MIYLDYAATTPVDKEIKELRNKIEDEFFASYNSLHFLGGESRALFLKNKEEVLALLGLKNHDLVLTQNATQANNLAIRGYTDSKNGNVVTTKLEHASVANVFSNLKGVEVRYVNSLPDGTIDISDLKTKVDKNTILVSVMWVNNITGSILPIKEVIEVVKNYPRAKLHVDMVQGFGKTPLTFSLNDIDFFTFSLHKIYGPKGIGGLFFNKFLPLSPIINGSMGTIPLMPGTQDTFSMVAINTLFKKYVVNPGHLEHVKKLWLRLNDYCAHDEHFLVNSCLKNSSFYVYNVSVKNHPSQTTVNFLSSKGIMISAGAACSSKKIYDKVIYELFKDEKRASECVRISFSYLTTLEEIDELIKAFKEYTCKNS